MTTRVIQPDAQAWQLGSPVADIYNDDYLLGKAIEFKLPQESIDKERAIGQVQRENFRRAVQAGVKVAFGTDAGVYPHGDNGKQFFYMVKFGLTPARAIRSAAAMPPPNCSGGRPISDMRPLACTPTR